MEINSVVAEEPKTLVLLRPTFPFSPHLKVNSLTRTVFPRKRGSRNIQDNRSL